MYVAQGTAWHKCGFHSFVIRLGVPITVISQLNAHLRVSTHPPFLMILWLRVYTVITSLRPIANNLYLSRCFLKLTGIYMGGLVLDVIRTLVHGYCFFKVRKCKGPMGAYSGEYSRSEV